MGGCFGDVVGRWTAHDDFRHPTTSDDVEACDDGLGVGVGLGCGFAHASHRARRRAPPTATDDDDQRRTSDHKGRIGIFLSRSRIAVAVVRDVAQQSDAGGVRARGGVGVCGYDGWGPGSGRSRARGGDVCVGTGARAGGARGWRQSWRARWGRGRGPGSRWGARGGVERGDDDA